MTKIISFNKLYTNKILGISKFQRCTRIVSLSFMEDYYIFLEYVDMVHPPFTFMIESYHKFN